ncbi:MAG: M3 family metallopeptidase [Pseudomonadota bacterium]|nr:M3 family metallopeptidase [Pseudomonadota bacterium]
MFISGNWCSAVTETFAEIDGLPDFSRINPDGIEKAIHELLATNREEVAGIVARARANPAWDSLVAPLEEIDDRLTKAWVPISHLNAVVNTEALRTAHDGCLVALTQYSTELGQSQPLYEAYKNLRSSKSYDDELSSAQKKVVDNALIDFELSGVGLDEQTKKRFADISERLAVLASQFQNNVLDASDAWTRHFDTSDSLAGLPDVNLAIAAEAARTRDLDGYVVTLEMPSYAAVMDHAEDRELRREVHEAYVTRASDRGPCSNSFDNTEIMTETLSLRHEQARLLGYSNYAELSVVKKMTDGPAEIKAFLENLLEKSLPKAREDLDELSDFALEKFGIEEVRPWDTRFLSEQLRQEKYAISEEELRPYFPLEKVLTGMFEVVERLYGIRVQRAVAPDHWHDDVLFFEIFRERDRIARFYLDAFARPHKQGGAWMNDCRVRRESGNFLQLPAAFLTCNFTPPVGDVPALLTHSEVVTLFHEFGHGLHHMLTRQTCAAVSGINGVSWDAVELPSQFMENWCWQAESISLISGHWQTHDSLPEALLKRLLEARNFQSGLAMVRQLEFGLLDMALHTSQSALGPLEAMLDVRKRTGLVRAPEYDRFPWAFGHIFSGGYAAGYYSYLWSEVLSADAFGAFEEIGVFDRPTGRRFLHEILETGGSKDAIDSYKAFRGRPPDSSALLRHNGLVTT